MLLHLNAQHSIDHIITRGVMVRYQSTPQHNPIA